MEWLMMALALASAAPQPVERDIPVKAYEDWTHSGTGLVLTPRLGGLPRTALTDATRTERDVTARFEAPDQSLSATIYVFHPALADVGVWFDSAQAGLESGQTFRDAERASAEPAGFTVGAGRSASALRQVYSTRAGPYRSTALAIVPVGEWIVSMRLNTKVLTASQLQARLQEVIEAVRWPNSADAAVAVPVAACPTPLTAIPAAHADDQAAKPASRPIWCREGEARAEYSVYRPDRGAAAFVLLVNDTGGVVSVYPAPKDGAYAVTLKDVDGTVSTFPSVTSLPTPDQVWQLIGRGKR
jgi:hypothetical protein